MRHREYTVGTRLTEIEYPAARLAAESAGVKLSEWLRQVVCARTSGPDPLLVGIAEEVLALRLILQNVIVYLTTDGKEVNRAGLTALASRADELKVEKARRLLDRLAISSPPEQ